jgi:hypothetical protein
MFLYKSKCRFPFLIAVNNQVIEVFPNQVLESNELLNFPNLILMEDNNEPEKHDAPTTTRKKQN